MLKGAPVNAPEERLAWTVLSTPDDEAKDREEVAQGLRATPKVLPCRFFYDERGSRLFERICELPEYYPTRTEHALLHARARNIARLTGPSTLIELGSGSSIKTRLLIDTYRAIASPLRYMAIDVSPTSLREGTTALLERYAELEVHGIVGTYEAGLAALGALEREPPFPRVVLFLGSTIGNFNPDETTRFLRQMRSALAPGDWFLVGTDLQKDIGIIEAAYNDAQGVTAAFNLNILRHINRRFRGNFALDHFTHLAFYDQKRHQIEMHLESTRAQSMTLAALGVTVHIERSERIRTEISRKFDLPTFHAELASHRLEVAGSWTDPRQWFALTLARAS